MRRGRRAAPNQIGKSLLHVQDSRPVAPFPGTGQPVDPSEETAMRTELISIPTETVPLDGALHWPDGPVTGAVLLFHGNTMNFYVGAPRFLPPALTRMGYACLSFNRRGHDILSIRNSRGAEGAAFQLTRESIEDNRIAA